MVAESIPEEQTVINTPQIRVLVIRGRGDGFCSGCDLPFLNSGKKGFELEACSREALAGYAWPVNSRP